MTGAATFSPQLGQGAVVPRQVIGAVSAAVQCGQLNETVEVLGAGVRVTS
jgi:hypothetical protein